MRGRPVTFSGFTGGVNYAASPLTLGDKEARDLRNVVATARGALRTRNGHVQAAVIPAEAGTLFGLRGGGLIAAVDDTLQFIALNGTVTEIGTGLAGTDRWDFIEAPTNGGQGPVYGSNGSAIVYWAMTAAPVATWTAATGTLPVGRYFAYHGNRVWAAGMTAYGALTDPGSAVVFSQLGDPRTWPVENVVLFDPHDGEAITGIGRVGPYLLVFKPSKTWLVYDLDTGANRALSTSTGSSSHRSIAESPQGTYFLSSDQGVMRTNGSSIDPVSDAILPILRQLPDAPGAAADFYDGHYYLTFKRVTGDNLIADYDTTLDAWFLHAPAPTDIAITDSRLYGARDGIGRVDQLFVADALTDPDDEQINSYWKSAYHTFGSPHRRKRVREIHLDGWSTDASLVVSADYGNQADRTVTDITVPRGETTPGADPELGQAKITTPGVARSWSLEIYDTGFELDAYTFLLQDRKD